MKKARQEDDFERGKIEKRKKSVKVRKIEKEKILREVMVKIGLKQKDEKE